MNGQNSPTKHVNRIVGEFRPPYQIIRPVFQGVCRKRFFKKNRVDLFASSLRHQLTFILKLKT